MPLPNENMCPYYLQLFDTFLHIFQACRNSFLGTFDYIES